LIDGVELANVADIADPEAVLDDVLENIKRSYQLGIVHADLSEHNIIIKPSGEVLIIDWPQWIPTSYHNAQELLERDVSNVLKYFRRKFRLKGDISQALEFIRG